MFFANLCILGIFASVFLNFCFKRVQGVKMLWKFKQLLNPAQVFDLINGGPKMGYVLKILSFYSRFI